MGLGLALTMLIATLMAWAHEIGARIKGFIVGAIITAWAVMIRITTGKWPDGISFHE